MRRNQGCNPVEHVMALRTIPGLRVIRPGDANETSVAWRLAIDGDGPTALALTRQDVPVLEGTAAGAVERGGYVLVEPSEPPSVAIVASGSELAVAVAAGEQLASDGIPARIVSLPCWSLFEEQDEAYRGAVLPPGLPTLSVEAGVSLGWDRYADASISIDRFGASAPAARVFEELGITPDAVAGAARHLISSRR